MRRELACLLLFVVLGLTLGVVHADVQTGLVGYWPMNEGTGTTTADASGNSHNGTLNKGATWVSPGFLGSAAIKIDGNPGSRVSLGTWDPGDQITLAVWAKWTGEQTKAERTGLIGKRNNWSADGIRWFSEVTITGQVRMRNYTQTVSSPAGAMTAKIDEWAHVVIACDGATARIYLDAEQVGSGNFTLGPLKTGGLGLGCKEGGGNTNTEIFSGSLDEARIYNRVLSVLEVRELFEWTDLPGKAYDPSPGDGLTDVARDVLLSWTSGEFTPAANGHKVCFSESLEDVLNGVGAVTQDANTYAPPQPLDFGKTYYWRVDEVNKTPDKPLFKGPLWSFTVEPYAYPISPVAVTASGAQPDMGPEKTIDDSGLTGDQHGVDQTTMWLSDGAMPGWIRYEFDSVYKLHEVTVWNHNQLLENVLGFGVKDVTIEYSLDDATWTQLSDVTIPQASGATTYTGTTIDLAGVQARFIRLAIRNNWNASGSLTQAGLSEVRFFHVPVKARLPLPASAATGVSVGALLSWRPGREAASHRVCFGTDPNAVASGETFVATITGNSYDPGPLSFGRTYYWKISEVNEARTPSVWEGDVWSFSTSEHFVVDDFESYTNESPNRVFQTWIDGVGYTEPAPGHQGNDTGSIVGYDPALGNIMETVIFHDGKQSMPMDYNNANPPFYSEAERTWDEPQDWTGNGADTLTLYFRGYPIAFMETAPGSFTMSGGGTDIWNAADQFRFAFKRLSGNGVIIAKVQSLVDTDPWVKAGVMIRESLDPGSRFAAVYVTPGNGCRFQLRSMTSTNATSDSSPTNVTTPEQIAMRAPYWIKLERSGNSFSGFYSVDGLKWTTLSWSPQTVNMGSDVYVGLAVTSHDATAVTTVEFSDVATTGAAGAWTAQAIGADQPANSPAPLYVAVQDSAGKMKAVSHPGPAATTFATWQQWRIPLSDFTSGGVKMTAVKKLFIGVGDRSNASRDGAGRIFIDDIGVGHPAE